VNKREEEMSECENRSEMSAACELKLNKCVGQIKDIVQKGTNDVSSRLQKLELKFDNEEEEIKSIKSEMKGNGKMGFRETRDKVSEHIKSHQNNVAKTLKIIGVMLLVIWQVSVTAIMAKSGKWTSNTQAKIELVKTK
jgi:hypothetical protein